jgi:tRNA (guanine-N7-)-methyltransferase
MGKNKLKHFAELDLFTHVIQHPYQKENFDHPLKGRWNTDFFCAAQPITLEVGCGKGEYTVGLARLHPRRAKRNLGYISRPETEERRYTKTPHQRRKQ